MTEEWASIEYELLRERGLWGPPIGSHLDKFTLEMTEGPCRMRKKMVRNDMFYIHYPYIPEIEPNTNSAQVVVSASDILQKQRLEVHFLPPFCSFLGATFIFHYFAKAVKLTEILSHTKHCSRCI